MKPTMPSARSLFMDSQQIASWAPGFVLAVRVHEPGTRRRRRSRSPDRARFPQESFRLAAEVVHERDVLAMRKEAGFETVSRVDLLVLRVRQQLWDCGLPRGD